MGEKGLPLARSADGLNNPGRRTHRGFGPGKDGGRLLHAGDYVETLPNDLHRVEALVDTLRFVRLAQLPIYGIVSTEEEGDIE